MATCPVLLRGGGDLASGVALRLHRAGFSPIITEVAAPLAVRRRVSFSEAVFDGKAFVEGIESERCESREQVLAAIARRVIPVLVDPALEISEPILSAIGVLAIVDARMTKRSAASLAFDPVIGLGPGFTPGRNCAAVVETMRGHTLGRVILDRPAAADTGLPDGDPARVLHAPVGGTVEPQVDIGDRVVRGETVAVLRKPGGVDLPIAAGVSGVVRGMIRPGLEISAGTKIGDIDARNDPALCDLVSDKALAVGGGVLEALLHIGAVGLLPARGPRNEL